MDCSGSNKILYSKKIRPSQKNFKLFINNIKDKQFPITIFFISDKFLGLDKILTIESKNDKKGQIFSLYNENLNNIITKINSCLENKNSNKDDDTKSKLSKSIMKDIENQKLIEKEFDIKLNPNTTPKSPIKSRSPTPTKRNKNRKKNHRKKNKKLENSDNENDLNNSAMPELNKENKDINENDNNNDNVDKTQMKITNFTTDKKNNDESKFHVAKIYGENNINSGDNKMNELIKIKKSKKRKKVKISTQNLINDLNDLDKNENEYDFDFLNKYEKFDNETNSMFDLFTAPKKNKANINGQNIFEGDNSLNNNNKNNKVENNENNQKSDLGFLNAIEDLNKYL